MSRARTFPIARAWYALLLAWIPLTLAGGVRDAPYTPADDLEIVERLPIGVGEARELRLVRVDALTEEPSVAAERARRYLTVARGEGDIRLYGYARVALEPWWYQENAPPEIRVLRAIGLQAEHDFSQSLGELDRVLKAEPRYAQAWLTGATVPLAKEEPRPALGCCFRLNGLLPGPIPAACAAAAAGRLGRAEAAYALVTEALATGTDTDPSVLVWALSIQAELAERLDRYADAEAAYRRAMDLKVRDTRLLAAYADFLLERGRPSEVVALLAEETRSFGPRLRLALAEQRLASPGVEERKAPRCGSRRAGRSGCAWCLASGIRTSRSTAICAAVT